MALDHTGRIGAALRTALWAEVREVLIVTGGDRTMAAECLGLTRRQLYRMLTRYHLLDDVRALDLEHGWRDYWPGIPRDKSRHSP